jgi:N-carbamoyl-L-amino-acid hydrolase
MSLTVNIERLRHDLETLRTIGRVESGGVSRTSFSPADREARQWYQDRCAEANLVVAADGLGNMVTRAPHESSDRSPIWTGSHLDSVPNGGHLDGALGTIAALECLRRLTEEKISLAHPVRAVVFTDEEGNYAHLLGSTGIAKGFDRLQLEGMTGRDNDRLVDRFADWGWDVDAATRTRVDPGEIRAFVELHIEQGPNLEASGIDIGVVTSIVGLGGGKVQFHGRADHAGTTPMTTRKDALLGAAEFLTTLPKLAASISDDAVITCGLIGVEPGGANVVPGTATLTLDFRDPDLARLRALYEVVERSAFDVAAKHDLTLSWHPDTLVEPVPLDSGIRDLITASAKEFGYSYADIPSGAGHDSQNMAWIAPTAMVFVPSKDGRSHSPAEDTSWEDIEKGANVLLATLVALASGKTAL